MRQTFYKLFFNSAINRIIRKFNKSINPYFLNKVKISPSSVFKLKVDNYTLKIAVKQTSYVGHLLFWNGYENFEYSVVFAKLIPKVNCFIDIGVNFGYYSLLASVVNPNAKIIGFEPASGPFYYFKKNVKLNNANVIVEPIAISDKKGTVDFYEMSNLKYKYLKYNLGGEGNTESKTQKSKFKIKKV